MTTLLPNLSGLKLSSEDDQEAPEPVEIGTPYKQLKAEPPEEHIRFETQYRDALFHNNKLLAIADAIENRNRVVWSTNRTHLYETMPENDHFAVGTRRWWWEWRERLHHDGDLDWIGGGSWNDVYIVPKRHVRRTLPEDCFQLIFDQKTAPENLVIRMSKKGAATKEEVIREMITAAYAHFYGFGPVIFAQFYIRDQDELNLLKRGKFRRLPWDFTLNESTYKGPRASLRGNPTLVYTVAEAWQGNCGDRISSRSGEPQFEPSEFAAEFVALCMRAAKVGFWHMDIKRENLLYRTSECRPLELSFTDFDAYFCRILSPSERSETYKCCVAATAACFLGEIRCSEGIDKWREYSAEVKKALKTFAGIEIDKMQPTDWCFFLRATYRSFGEHEMWRVYETLPNGQRQIKKVLNGTTDMSKELEEVGDRFRNHLKNYIREDANGPLAPPECFRFESGIPLFHQIVNFAFTDPP